MTRRAVATSGSDRELAHRLHFLEANLSSIPDYVYAFDRERRFAYANPAMLALFGLTADEMIGKNFADLDYPPDLAALLNGHIDRIFAEGVTVEDEVFYQTPSGHAAFFAYLWGPVRGDDGTIEQVIGVSRDTSERHAYEEALRTSEARLRAATELVGLGIYSWDPITGALEWDERLRAMWGLPPMRQLTRRCTRPVFIPTTCRASIRRSPPASILPVMAATQSNTVLSVATTGLPGILPRQDGRRSSTAEPWVSSAPPST